MAGEDGEQLAARGVPQPRCPVLRGGDDVRADIALETSDLDSDIVTAKTVTTPGNPVEGVLTGIELALRGM